MAQHRGRPGAPVIEIAPVAAPTARYAVQNWHYSHTLPAGPSMRFGIWESGRFLGVVIFGRGAAPNLGRAQGFALFEVCELTRIALRDHVAPVSQIVPLTVAALRSASPGTRVVFSFADPYRGHRGTIYQAMNWLYLGTSVPVRAFRDRATGELHHNRVVGAGYVRQFDKWVPGFDPARCELIAMPGKHRYALPLDRAARRQLARLQVPYPAAEVSTVTR